MACDYGGFPLDGKLKDAAQQAAVAMGRGEANIEDQIRAANALAQGLKILGDDRHTEVISALMLCSKSESFAKDIFLIVNHF